MRGHIRQRSKGSWNVVLYLGKDAKGKPIQKWHTVHGTKRDAERRQAELVHEVNSGAYVAPSHLTLGQYLERWLTHSATQVRPKTHERYAEIANVHLVPALGHVSLDKLKPMQIQSYYDEALSTGRRRDGKGLSPQTVLHHHRVLKGALRQAVLWQLLSRNPADAVVPPRPEVAKVRVLTEEETATLLASIRTSVLYPPTALALATGMRRGEVLGLRWAEVDFDEGKLRVVATLGQTKAGVSFGEPKTAKSRRVVALPRSVVETLRAHKAKQAKARLLLGSAYMDHGLVFPLPDGRPWEPDRFTESFLSFADKHGFEGLRFHDLRHTHATQLLRGGLHPKVVSERLGHSNIGITLNTYSHVLPDMQQEAAIAIDKVLRVALAEG